MSQYPQVIYPAVMKNHNRVMERTEHWRQRLLELKVDLGLKQVELAEATSMAPNYVSRLLYEPGKPGRKNLGLDTIRALREAYKLSADWFDLPLGSALPTARTTKNITYEVTEPIVSYNVSRVPEWPFQIFDLKRIQALKESLGPKLAAEAIADLDAQLDIVASKWERRAAEGGKKTKSS